MLQRLESQRLHSTPSWCEDITGRFVKNKAMISRYKANPNPKEYIFKIKVMYHTYTHPKDESSNPCCRYSTFWEFGLHHNVQSQLPSNHEQNREFHKLLWPLCDILVLSTWRHEQALSTAWVLYWYHPLNYTITAQSTLQLIVSCTDLGILSRRRMWPSSVVTRNASYGYLRHSEIPKITTWSFLRGIEKIANKAVTHKHSRLNWVGPNSP